MDCPMIEVLIRPNDRCWSGNPIYYHLYSAAAEADSSIFFEIQIFFKRTDQTDFSNIVTLPYNPVKGSAKFDIKGILDGLLEYEVPGMSVNNEMNSPFFANKMTGTFYIKYREISSAIPDPVWTVTENGFIRFVIKGGISFSKWRGDNYWVNYYDPLKPFLTWQKSGRLASADERIYLAWLNLTSLNQSYIKMRRAVGYSDGTRVVTDFNCPATSNQVAFFPSGYKQLEIGSIDPLKRVEYWELQVWDVNAIIPISELFRFYLDNRNDRNDITLNYRNSLGGLDSARIRGVIEFTLNREFEIVESISIYNYFEGNFVSPRTKAINSTETLIYKGDIGFIAKEEQDRLRDSHYKRECWWAQNQKWLPIMILTGSQKLKTNLDHLWSLPIEFSISDGGDGYYTPASVNLAEGAIPNVQACNAVISDPIATVNEPGWLVSWELVSGAPVKYLISTPGVNGGVAYETTELEYQFPWLPDGENIIKVTPVCQVGDQFIGGEPHYVTINIAPACVAAAIIGAPELPAAKIGNNYAYFIALSGTAPFVLANIVKPAWMVIEVAGNTINFSGTPEAGDIGEDIEVSFDIENCEGNNSIEFDGTIDVEEPQYNFFVTNPLENVIIGEVVPAFFLIDVDGFPVLPGHQLKGYHNGYDGAIVFTVVLTGSPINVRIYVNDVSYQFQEIPESGYYSFSWDTYSPTDKIEIKAENP
jgi:hypothetical protein